MARPVRVCGIAGSLRKGSYNRALLRAAIELAPDGLEIAVCENDPRRPALIATAELHRRAGLAAVTGAHYEGGHWLGSFAVYLVTKRGLTK